VGLAGAEDGGRDEGEEASGWVLQEEIAVGDLSAQDRFSGAAVDLEVVGVLPEVGRQRGGKY
jgi:hypothetical protein